jgi:hypothetical protein
MKPLFILLFPFLFLCSSAIAQDVTVRSINNHPVHTYSFGSGTVAISGNTAQLSAISSSSTVAGIRSWSVSPGKNYFSAITTGEQLSARLIDSGGSEINTQTLEFFDPADQSVRVYSLNNGAFITRDNIANFTFFSAGGKEIFRISNSTGSGDGESVSELSHSSRGTGILLYNPRVVYGNNLGSRARMVFSERNIREIYNSRNRDIKFAKVSENGSYVILITQRIGADNRVHIYDRFGNEIGEIESTEDLIGASLSDNGSHITIFSSRRAQVFTTSDLEQAGSTSFRVSVAHAAFIPQDNQIVALCGTADGNGVIQNPEVHVIHTTRRQIARTDVNTAVSIMPNGGVSIQRSAANRFVVNGLNRRLEVRTSF